MDLVLPTHNIVMECERQGDREEENAQDCVACSPVLGVEAKLSIC